MKKFPLAVPTWDKKELAAIQSVVDSGHFTMGKCVKDFEDAFAQYFGSNYAVMVNSGSSANLLAIAALFYRKNSKLKRGNEVIVPAISWPTTYYPLYQYGLKLKFVDVDLDTLNYDLVSLEEAVSEKTKAIISVNILGNPNDFSRIQDIIQGKDIILIEDNCESMGAKFDNGYTGTFGLMGTFSTFFSHHISTMEGGMVLTDDEELVNILKSLRAHGWTRDISSESELKQVDNDPFMERFNFVLPGYNVRPLEISAAVGIEQLKKLPVLQKVRNKNSEKFTKLFKGNNDFIFQKSIGISSWFAFSMIISPSSLLKRSEIVMKLERNGIECRPLIAGDFTAQSVVKYFDYTIHGDLSNARHIHENGFYIGNHGYDLSDEIELLAETLEL